MFRGTSFHTMDNKGRIIIPSRFRDLIRAGGGDRVMVSSMDGCLVAYPLDAWRDLETGLLARAEKSHYMRRFRRIFVGGAHECACDKQERILIPPMLREDADITKEIVLVGVLDHFEIWSRGMWDSEKQALNKDMQKEEVRNEIASLGL
ncbi:MAG: division/cell wall cluster transcriptional repressor MraZ [Desulfobacterales bacterium]|jgi:MraZ protein